MGLREIVSEAKRKGYSRQDIVEILLKKGYSENEINSVFSDLTGDIKNGEIGNEDIGVVEKIKLLFSSPNDFFSRVNDKGIGKSCLLLFLAGLISTAIGIVFNLIISSAMYGSSQLDGGLEMGKWYSLFSFGFSFILFFAFFAGSFVSAGVMHLVVMLFKGSGGYSRTYNALAYSLVVYYVLAIIPYVGFLGGIYSIVLAVFGLSAYHEK